MIWTTVADAAQKIAASCFDFVSKSHQDDRELDHHFAVHEPREAQGALGVRVAVTVRVAVELLAAGRLAWKWLRKESRLAQLADQRVRCLGGGRRHDRCAFEILLLVRGLRFDARAAPTLPADRIDEVTPAEAACAGKKEQGEN